ATLAGRIVFPTIEQAVSTVTNILHAAIPVARIELVDARSVQQVNKTNETNYIEKPTLFIEFHGNEAGLNQDVAFAKSI
ncbi:FAD-linked oxidase C-terminal domain-containing protein, partial [Micrococcus sp. SIMBA_144]